MATETTVSFNEHYDFDHVSTTIDLTAADITIGVIEVKDSDNNGRNEIYFNDAPIAEVVPITEDYMPPVLLDLDGDGVELVSLEHSAALFDANRDGIPERLSWLGPDDGILVYDRDGDGLARKSHQGG